MMDEFRKYAWTVGNVETVDTGEVGGSRFELRETIGRVGGNGGVEGRV